MIITNPELTIDHDNPDILAGAVLQEINDSGPYEYKSCQSCPEDILPKGPVNCMALSAQAFNLLRAHTTASHAALVPLIITETEWGGVLAEPNEPDIHCIAGLHSTNTNRTALLNPLPFRAADMDSPLLMQIDLAPALEYEIDNPMLFDLIQRAGAQGLFTEISGLSWVMEDLATAIAVSGLDKASLASMWKLRGSPTPGDRLQQYTVHWGQNAESLIDRYAK